MAATGTISEEVYIEQDILNPLQYAKMKIEPLINEQDELVVPVRNLDTPHFRRIGRASFGRRIGRSEDDPTHDKCVQQIFDHLQAPGQVKTLLTYFFPVGSQSREEQVVFATGAASDYRWVKEEGARIAFHDGTYIQPDLAGRDANRFFPRASCPNIIIEVIRTHPPEANTFERLCELSLANTIVVFYFIGEERTGGLLNHMIVESGSFTLRVSHYMIGGQLYNNGLPVYDRAKYSTAQLWYSMVKSSYFERAMKKISD
ncbi:hypothetical protein M2262_003224 [Pseudomonas sp. BIGb0408]|uniref:Restriction endonuclease n=1 Tax=Phytopseudomonas flavescens TaxID=29435 RepID=A0A7Y9XIX6_9GAMM|nr:MULTISPECIES: hypothetical protein [Pseudomonas]MCW2293174.1 hypothetical protein [Pseudomonas sp. BIGb0408]NYH72255.1 hypothetical protein [Pseudomonas flavescens]